MGNGLLGKREDWECILQLSPSQSSSVPVPGAFSSLACWVGVREGLGVNEWGFIQGKWIRRYSLSGSARLACVGASVPRQAFHTSGRSTLHSWKGPSFHRNVDGFVMSYLLICSWRLSFLLQVLSFPSLFVYQKILWPSKVILMRRKVECDNIFVLAKSEDIANTESHIITCN